MQNLSLQTREKIFANLTWLDASPYPSLVDRNSALNPRIDGDTDPSDTVGGVSFASHWLMQAPHPARIENGKWADEFSEDFGVFLIHRERGDAWATALDENEHKGVNEMRNADGGRCCLCVAQDIGHAVCPGRVPETSSAGDGATFPSLFTKKYFGWPSHLDDNAAPNPLLPVVYGDFACLIESSRLNDCAFYEDTIDTWARLTRSRPIDVSETIPVELSHKQIAECVRNLFVRPHRPVFTFRFLADGQLEELSEPLTLNEKDELVPLSA